MPPSALKSGGLWSVILPGSGTGRVGGFIERWLGHAKPKEYCAFVGARSLFQHAVDRAAILSRREHIIAVVPPDMRREAAHQLGGRGGVTLLSEPHQAGTVSQLYVSLAYVRAKDPYSTVVIYPSDHFFYPEHVFLTSVQHAASATEWLSDQLLLLAVQPERLELDYTWVVPGDTREGSFLTRVKSVQRLLHKPTVVEADKALAEGALWHTSVLVAKTELLWQLGWECFPDLMVGFEEFHGAIGTREETALLHQIYQDMPRRNLETHLLANVPKQSAVMEMNGVLWSDWDAPERIAHTLRRIGREPAFPLACLTKPFVPFRAAHSDGLAMGH